ncbi:MAG: DUF3575 domain-containing protein [Rikenellaceae bacterium]|jgi:hypothetical protein|nr:DUF3575 domain-containing protein [Rikenellaceae bacterium]
MKTKLIALSAALLLFAGAARGQSVRINLPFLLAGSPNIGAEFTLNRQLSLSGDLLWMPYMFKKNEEVFRTLIGVADLRYYVRPTYYYTNNTVDGLYFGPYAMYGLFNIGPARYSDPDRNRRYRGWGMSGGLTAGYRFFIARRFSMDANIGLGFAHLQYDTFRLGGEYSCYPLSKKDTKMWFGPTRIGLHLVYNLTK